jgi:hypothetical protein
LNQDPNASQRYLDELRRQLVRLPQAERWPMRWAKLQEIIAILGIDELSDEDRQIPQPAFLYIGRVEEASAKAELVPVCGGASRALARLRASRS